MKAFIMILLLAPIITHAQKEPSKWDDAVVIYGGKSNLTSLKAYLLEHGFSIKSENKNLNILYTDYIRVPKALYSYNMTIKQSEGKIVATAFIKKVYGGRDPQASWRGGIRGADKTVFYHMHNTISKYAKSVNATIETAKFN